MPDGAFFAILETIQAQEAVSVTSEPTLQDGPPESCLSEPARADIAAQLSQLPPRTAGAGGATVDPGSGDHGGGADDPEADALREPALPLHGSVDAAPVPLAPVPLAQAHLVVPAAPQSPSALPAEALPALPVAPRDPPADVTALASSRLVAPTLAVAGPPDLAAKSVINRDETGISSSATPDFTSLANPVANPSGAGGGVERRPVSASTVSVLADLTGLQDPVLPAIRNLPLPPGLAAPPATDGPATMRLSARTSALPVSLPPLASGLAPLPAPVPAGVVESVLRLTMQEPPPKPDGTPRDAPAALAGQPDALLPDTRQNLVQTLDQIQTGTETVPPPQSGQASGMPSPGPAATALPVDRVTADAVSPLLAPEPRPQTAAVAPAPGAQIATALSQSAEGTVELILAPAELGRLRMELVPEGELLRVTVSVERPETLDMLRRNADVLLAEIRQAGFTGAQLSFGSWGGQKGSDPAPRPHDNPPSEDAAPGVPPPFFRPSPAPSAAGAGLDLRL